MVKGTNKDAQEDKNIEDPTEVEGKWLYLKETVLRMKEDIETDSKQKFPIFDALVFIKRDNHMIVRVHVGDDKYVDVSMMSQKLDSYQLNKKFDDLLQFD